MERKNKRRSSRGELNLYRADESRPWTNDVSDLSKSRAAKNHAPNIFIRSPTIDKKKLEYFS